MKEKVGKYIFITVVSSLIIVSLFVFFKTQNQANSNGTSNAEEKQLKYSKILNLSICNFDNINPLISKNKDVINISKLVFEPLISLDENYRTEYVLAKECAKVSDKSYLIKLNNEVKWQDGRNFTSKDVEFTINELKKIDSIYSEEVKQIENLEIIDDYTIKISLKEKIDFFEYYLNYPILPYHIYESGQDISSIQIPIGTGRFKIKTVESEIIVLEKNEYFRKDNEENSKIEKINIYLYKNIDEVYNNFKLGNIDLIQTDNINYQQYIGRSFYNIKEYKGREYDFISFNCKDSLLNRTEVRRAISCVINKENINSNIYNNKYYISNFPLDYGIFLYNEVNINQNTDNDEVKKILEDSGWNYENNKWQIKNNRKITNLSLELIVQESNFQRVKVSEEIKKQLEEVGIGIKINKVSDNEYLKYLENKNYQMILTGVNNGLNPNLEYFFGKNNLAQYENEEITNIMNEILQIENESLLQEKYKKIIQIQSEDCPYIALYRNKEQLILNQNINGEFMPNNYNIFYKIWTWYKKGTV